VSFGGFAKETVSSRRDTPTIAACCRSPGIATGDADAARAGMAAHIHRIRDAALAPVQASGSPA